MFSFIGEIVLDPFLGSGTTTKVAAELNRNSIGYEINKNYLKIIKEKIGIDKKSLFKNADFEIIYQKADFKKLDENIANYLNTPSQINHRVNHPDAWKLSKTKWR